MKKISGFSVVILVGLILGIGLISGTCLYGQMPGMPQSRHHAWSDTSLSPDERADLVIKELTLDEKIQLLHGLGWLATMVPPESGPGTRAILR